MSKFLITASALVAFIFASVGGIAPANAQVVPTCATVDLERIEATIANGWGAQNTFNNAAYDQKYWIYTARTGTYSRSQIVGMAGCATLMTAAFREQYVSESEPIRKEQLHLLTASWLRITFALGETVRYMDANHTATSKR